MPNITASLTWPNALIQLFVSDTWQALLKINKGRQRCLNFFDWTEALGKFWSWLQTCSLKEIRKCLGFQNTPCRWEEWETWKIYVSVTRFPNCRRWKEHKMLSFPCSLWNTDMLSLQPAAKGLKFAEYQAKQNFNCLLPWESIDENLTSWVDWVFQSEAQGFQKRGWWKYFIWRTLSNSK